MRVFASLCLPNRGNLYRIIKGGNHKQLRSFCHVFPAKSAVLFLDKPQSLSPPIRFYLEFLHDHIANHLPRIPCLDYRRHILIDATFFYQRWNVERSVSCPVHSYLCSLCYWSYRCRYRHPFFVLGSAIYRHAGPDWGARLYDHDNLSHTTDRLSV